MNKCRNLHIYTCPYTFEKKIQVLFKHPWDILKSGHLFSMCDKVLNKKIIFSTPVK